MDLLRHRHAHRSAWPLVLFADDSLSDPVRRSGVMGSPGRRAGSRARPNSKRTGASTPARPAISVPVRSAPPSIHFALRHWPLRLCARPARTARSGGRGTLGRDLPGPAATLAARRRRRSFPTKHRREPRPRWEELPGYYGRREGWGKDFPGLNEFEELGRESAGFVHVGRFEAFERQP